MTSKSKLRKEFIAEGRAADCPVYDLHGHMGYHFSIHMPAADTESMVRSMKRNGVKMLAFCHHAALFAPDIGNQANIEAVRLFPKHLRAYCAVNPNYPEIVKKDMRTFASYPDVYIGFKFLADYHECPLMDGRYKPAWEYADTKKLLVLLHTWGGSHYDGPEQIEKAAREYSGAKILLGHSCHGEWDKAIELAKTFPNIHLELCAVMDERGILERFVEKLGSKRIVFGTDFPWFNHHYYIGAIINAGLCDEALHDVFHRNAEKLLGVLF